MTRELMGAGLALALILGAADTATAGERTAFVIDWATTKTQAGRRVAGPDGSSVVRIESEAKGTTTHPLATIARPPVGGVGYALVGRVRHERVAGEGYLEMWSQFEDGGRYFSRTLGQNAMAPLRGDAGWREFRLPFYLRGAAVPTKLEVNLVLPGPGKVEVGALRLVQLDARGAWAGVATSPWWDESAGGWIGAILGSVLGVFGAVIGTLCSLGRGRAFALGALRFGIALGVALVAAGAWAWLLGQPYAVWYPLLLGGALCAGVDAAVLPGARRRFEDVELRRMRARDVQEAGVRL